MNKCIRYDYRSKETLVKPGYKRDRISPITEIGKGVVRWGTPVHIIRIIPWKKIMSHFMPQSVTFQNQMSRF